ncbi:MAG TPA: 2-phospho-L-lactate guanylyltransferase [Glaciibacter sp.]|nr:2-phospho-L-lactate guanylyltransferase [Glaciibacter sp.]
MSETDWVAVVPVKGAPGAKSRLEHDDRAQLAEAFALDTVAALLAASVIIDVFVVTADMDIGAHLASLGAHIVPETVPLEGSDPLNAAIAAGVDAARAARPDSNLAVFTGDLPSLTVTDIEGALSLGAAYSRSMVPDEEGTGTTSLFALAGVPFTPRFGVGSRAAHEADGHHPLDLPATSSIRRDVDTAANLAEALHLGVGPYTSKLIAEVSTPIVDAGHH